MSDSISPIHGVRFDELSKRCWKLISTQGEEIYEGGPIMVDADLVTIELAYNDSGREFLDVMMTDDHGGRGGHRVYREVDGVRSSNMTTSSLVKLLESLRREMVLDDLADV